MIKRAISILILLVVGLLFLDFATHFRQHEELSPLGRHYTEAGPAELGAANLVTAVVVTYRGLDTLGEVTVLFISALGVGVLMHRRRDRQAPDTSTAPARPASEIVTTATEMLLPLIVLFGVYVFVNGHLTPGGGFQGGAIIASGALLLLLARPRARLSHLLLGLGESLSGFGYLVLGALGLVLAGGFLDNRILGLGEFGQLFSAGAIPLIYSLIGLKVGAELSALLDRFRTPSE